MSMLVTEWAVGWHTRKLSNGDWNSCSSGHFPCPHYTLHATDQVSSLLPACQVINMSSPGPRPLCPPTQAGSSRAFWSRASMFIPKPPAVNSIKEGMMMRTRYWALSSLDLSRSDFLNGVVTESLASQVQPPVPNRPTK